jgi:hypothetical protein
MEIASSSEERRQAMSTKKGFWRWALVIAAAMIVSGPARANVLNDPPSVTTNTSAGLLVFPKIVVNTANGVDTHIQLTNAQNILTKVHCFYVNANGHCSNNPSQICSEENFLDVCQRPGTCVPGCQETDFRLTLTKRQPISWNSSDGRTQFPLPPIPGEEDSAQSNKDSLIPPVPEDPFIGELRCVEVTTDSEEPIARNDLKGEATVVTAVGAGLDASKYTAIGIPSIDGAQDGDPGTLNLGGPNAEYNGCPNILTLDHFFNGATVRTHGNSVGADVFTRLTVVPCAADFLNQVPANATLQFLIYNEFEQRFSTSTKLSCYRDVALVDIDTRVGTPGDTSSIFAVGVQGTLTGQTRIRSVTGSSEDGYAGRGVLAVAEETWVSLQGVRTATANIQYQGTRNEGDQVLIPLP